MDTFDLIAIGGGTAGLTATTAAAGMGLRAALIEKHRIGGDCTWTGCVPSKALIRAARAAHDARTAACFGVHTTAPRVEMTAVRAHIRETIAAIYAHETPDALRAQGVTVIEGAARFIDPHTVQVGDDTLRARRFLIATGARPVTPDIPCLADVPHHTYETIFDIDALPESLVIIGAGAIGVELSQAFARLGAAVTLIGARLLPRADAEARTVIAAALARDGVRHIAAKADRVLREGDGVRVHAGRVEVSGTALLVAVGRAPVVDGLNLDAAGVAHSARGIAVDARLRTSQPHIYAAGDCTGGAQFTHYAGWAAFRAVQNAFLPLKVNTDGARVPWTIFTDPEIAQVGMTEDEARARFGDRIRIQHIDMARTDRALTDGAPDGFIKLIALPRPLSGGRLLGAVIVAPRAGELITEYALALDHGLSPLDLAGTIHPYPTYATAAQLAESGMVTAGLFSGRVGQIVRWLARRG
jgi:pyruvate/2-oxoglutarate dehydrogenase complex dihydrolipoamide dehydrogenase (E3) component